MTRALIADDEPHLARHLQQRLQELWPALEIVHVADNGVDAAAAIARLEPDLAFLDIQMPGQSGLEVAQGIEGHTRVIFVTAHDVYALQAFEHAAVDYLLKPLRTERLQRTIARLQAPPAAQPDAGMAQALQQLLRQAAPVATFLRYVRAAKGGAVHNLAVEDVLFFQADDKYKVVRTGADEFLIRTPIAELLGQLDPQQFWQVRRSTIVSLVHLASTRRDDASRLFLRMRGHPAELPVSRAYVHLF